MASTERLPSGKWRPIARDGAGRKLPSLGTFERKMDAAEAARNAETDARRKAAATKGTLSASTSWGDWWDLRLSKRTFDSDTLVADRSIVKEHVGPRWDEVPLNAITRNDVQTWVDGLYRSGLSPGYVTRIYRLLQGSMTAAVTEGPLTASPCMKIALPANRRKPMAHCTAEDITALTAEMTPLWADLVTVAFETGLRPNELAGLHSHRVHFDTGWLTVVDAYVMRARKIRGHPKDGDIREVPLTSTALEALRRQLGDRMGSCGFEHYKGKCSHPLVFLSDSGICTQQKQSYYLRKAAAAAGIEPRSPYTARRGFATVMRDKGVDPFTIGDMMGHGDLDVTKGYLQPTPAQRAKVLAALGEPTDLKAVGQNGTRRGTDSTDQPPSETVIARHEKRA